MKTDIRCVASELYFLPVQTRVPLKFGHELLTSATIGRVRLRVQDSSGRSAEGWGETPLSVQWVWPGSLPYEERHEALKAFTIRLAAEWPRFNSSGHPLEVGYAFQRERLLPVLKEFNASRAGREMPLLAALICCSLFDIALHDAFGVLHEIPIYQTYNARFMNRDLAWFLTPAADTNVSFSGKYPSDFLDAAPATPLPVWHLVGGVDALDAADLAAAKDIPRDGYPVTLAEWIQRDGLKCLKVKLRGNDEAWDYERLVRVGRIAIEQNADWLSADFNCTAKNTEYVNAILDRLLKEQPRIYGMILYVEQPFPYELEEHRMDVRSVSARKPLFLDESAHDWQMVALGRSLGWTGVALKTCKTQTGAILSLCWARAHGMTLMVQDLTNPMLAMIPHVQLAAYGRTIMGVECNAMQFYPKASVAEESVHPGIYARRNGVLDLSSIRGPGFGYRVSEIRRELPAAVATHGF
ncbi:MAG TPA: enolase C-terminal domain-like protein [Planctomycetota bacterium]|nr:enolase C-terminal domain-like protein [Planctomycetota bacterium]